MEVVLNAKISHIKKRDNLRRMQDFIMACVPRLAAEAESIGYDTEEYRLILLKFYHTAQSFFLHQHELDALKSRIEEYI